MVDRVPTDVSRDSIYCHCSPESRRPTKAIIENHLYIRYQGSCSDVRGAIAEAFVQTMSRLLDEEHGPCPPDFLCNVEEVRVLCGTPPVPANQRTLTTVPPRRHRRHIDEDNEADEEGGDTYTAVVMLVTSAQLFNATNNSAVIDQDRDGVMTALDGLSEAVWRQMIDVGLGDGSGHGGEAAVGDPSSAEVALEQLTVTEMMEVSRQWETITCREGEVLENDGTSNVCCKRCLSVDLSKVYLKRCVAGDVLHLPCVIWAY